MRSRSYVTALVLLACVVGGLSGGCSTPLSHQQHFVARFQNTLGLYKGNDVAILGYPVGKIDKLVTKGTYVEVSFSVDSDVKLPADVHAMILRPGIVTDRSLELAPVYSGGPQLRDGATIQMESTRQPVEYDELVAAIDDLMVALSPEGGSSHVVRDTVTDVAALLDGNGTKLQQALHGLADASQVAVDSSPDLKVLLHDLNVVVTAVARNEALVRSFSGNLADVTDLFAADGPRINAAFGSLAAAMTDVATFIKANRSLLVANAKRALVTARTLTSRTRALTEIVDQMPLTMENFHRAVDAKKGGLRSKVAWQDTFTPDGVYGQFCGQPVIPFLCALVGATIIGGGG